MIDLGVFEVLEAHGVDLEKFVSVKVIRGFPLLGLVEFAGVWQQNMG